MYDVFQKFQLEVGTIAMDVLITVLENDRWLCHHYFHYP